MGDIQSRKEIQEPSKTIAELTARLSLNPKDRYKMEECRTHSRQEE